MAALAGAFISGVAGIGGGTLLIGVMFAVGLSPVVAIPLHAAVQFVSNASRALAYRDHIDVRAALIFSVACVPWPFVMAGLVAKADPAVIRLVLAAAILISLSPHASAHLSARWSVRSKMLLAGILNGAVGMVIGATGLVIGPFFQDQRWGKETTVGTLALCQSVGHLLKIAAFGTLGMGLLEHWELAWPLMLAVAVGTFLGRQLMYRVSQAQFQRLFRAVLFLLAVRLLWAGIQGLL